MSAIEPSESGRSEDDERVRDLIEQARAGSAEAFGELLERCSCYLLGIARRELSPRVRAKQSASDVVQGTCLEAQRAFAGFTGQTLDDVCRWLRRILLRNLANVHTHYEHTAKRDVAREEVRIGDGSDDWEAHAARKVASPLAGALAGETRERMYDVLVHLPDDYREVLLLRHREDLAFREIALRMNRSDDSARKLWIRAITAFHKRLKERGIL